MDTLTERQTRVLQYLEWFWVQHTRFPTYQEVMEFMGVASSNAVNNVFLSLEKKGYIRRANHHGTGCFALVFRKGVVEALLRKVQQESPFYQLPAGSGLPATANMDA